MIVECPFCGETEDGFDYWDTEKSYSKYRIDNAGNVFYEVLDREIGETLERTLCCRNCDAVFAVGDETEETTEEYADKRVLSLGGMLHPGHKSKEKGARRNGLIRDDL